jgi:hypothetical protein
LSDLEMLEYLQTNVYRDGDCLNWAGPAFSISGAPRVGWQRRSHLARRLLLQLLGRDPGPKKVTHRCDSPICMNPEHLIALEHRALVRRSAAQGHWQVGAIRSMRAAVGKAKTARLPITEARAVMQARAAGQTYKAIGERYGVHSTRVFSAIKAWRRAGVTA